MKRHRKHVKVNLKRAGQTAYVLRQSGGTRNGYGKITDDSGTWDQVDITSAVLDFEHGEKFQPENVSGGTRDMNRPEYRVPYDADIQDGDRLRIDNREYEVENIAPYPTHYVLKTVMINA